MKHQSGAPIIVSCRPGTIQAPPNRRNRSSANLFELQTSNQQEYTKRTRSSRHHLCSERIPNEIKLDQRHALHPTYRISHACVKEKVRDIPLEEIRRAVFEVEGLPTRLACGQVSLSSTMIVPGEDHT